MTSEWDRFTSNDDHEPWPSHYRTYVPFQSDKRWDMERQLYETRPAAVDKVKKQIEEFHRRKACAGSG